MKKFEKSQALPAPGDYNRLHNPLQEHINVLSYSI
jgi:hypothetical protein